MIKLSNLLRSVGNGDFEEVTDNSLDYIKDQLIDGGELLSGYEFSIHVYKVTPSTFIVFNDEKEYLCVWYSFCKENDTKNTCLCSKGSIENVNWANVLRLRNEVWEIYRDKSYQTNKYRPVFNSTEIDVYE